MSPPITSLRMLQLGNNPAICHSHEIAQLATTTIQLIPDGQNQVLPYIFFLIREVVTIGKKRSSQFPFHADFRDA